MCTVGMTNYANDIFKYCFISSNMSREDEQFKRDTERALAFSEKESRSKEQQDMDKALALSLKERTTAAALARHQQKTAGKVKKRAPTQDAAQQGTKKAALTNDAAQRGGAAGGGPQGSRADGGQAHGSAPLGGDVVDLTAGADVVETQEEQQRRLLATAAQRRLSAKR
jgi:hypothetical protein